MSTPPDNLNHSFVYQAQTHLFSNELDMAWTFYSGMPRDDAISNLLDIFNDNIPITSIISRPAVSPISIKWIAISFLARLGHLEQDHFPQQMPAYVLQVVCPKLYDIVESLRVQDSDTPSLSASQCKAALALLSQLMNDGPSLVNALLAHLAPLIEAIPTASLFSSLGFSALTLFAKPPIQFLAASPLKIKEFSTLFEYPQNFLYPTISELFQLRLSSSFQFPSEFPKVPNGKAFSIANQSASKKIHFSDIIFNYLRQIEDPLQILDNTTFQELNPWVVLIHIKRIIGSFQILRDVKRKLKTYDQNSIAISVIKRFYNDVRLLILVGKITKAPTSSSILRAKSLPLLLKDMFSSPGADGVLSRQYFAISDKDLTIDVDFIRADQAIEAALKVIGGSMEAISELDRALSKISTNSVEIVCMEVVCTIFLQNGSEFICQRSSASSILEVLCKYSLDIEIKKAATWLRLIPEGSENLRSCMITRKALFLIALGKHDFASASLFADNESEANLECSKLIFEGNSWAEGSKLFASADAILSTEGHISKYKFRNDVSLLIEKRKDNGLDSLLVPKNALAFSMSFDKGQATTADGVDLPRNTKEFIDFFSKLSQNSFENGFRYGFRPLLVSLLRDDHLDEANSIVGSAGVDLFEFILEAGNNSSLGQEFFSKYCTSHSLECIALATESGMSIPYTPTEKVVQNYLKNWKSSGGCSQFVIDLQNPVFDQQSAEDTYYSVPYQEIVATLGDYSSFRMRQLAALLGIYPDLCSFTELQTLCDCFSLISKDELYNPTVQSFRSSDALNDLAHMFPIPIRFTSSLFFIKMMFVEPELSKQIASLTIPPNPSSLSEILVAFPPHFPLIFHSFPLSISFISVFKEHCPIEYLTKFTAFVNLPPEVIKASIFNDPPSISAAFRSYPSNIPLIREDVAVLIDSSSLSELFIYFLKTFPIPNSAFAANMKTFTSRFPQTQQTLNAFTVSLFTDIIKSISVSDLTSEKRAIRTLSSLSYFSLPSSFKSQIEALSSFASSTPFSLKSIPYEFSTFPKGMHSLIEIAFLIEKDSIALNLCQQFSISISEFALPRLECCLELGLSAESRFWASHSSPSDSILVRSLLLQPIFDREKMKSILSIDRSAIAKSMLPELSIYKTVSRGFVSRTDNDDFLYYCSNFVTPVSKSIGLLCRYGFFDNAFNFLCSIPDPNEFVAVFVNTFVLESISHGRLDDMLKFIRLQDPGMSFSMPLWNGLFAFLRDHYMIISLLHFYIETNSLEDASQSAIEVAMESERIKEKQKYIGLAETLLDQSLMIRQGSYVPSESTFPFHPSDESEANLIMLRQQLKAQSEVVKWLTEQPNQSVLSEFQFLKDPSKAFNVAVKLFSFCQFDICDLITVSFRIKISEIIEKATEVLCESGYSGIRQFLSKARNRPSLFAMSLESVLKSMIMKNEMWSHIPELISTFIEDSEEQVAAFISYGFLGEALKLANLRSMKKYIPIIAWKASQVGNAEIVSSLQH